MTMENGVRLQRELIIRDVRRPESRSLCNIINRHRQVLPGQRIHEVEIYAVEAGANRGIEGRENFVRAVNSPEFLQRLRIKTLGTQRKPVDTSRRIVAKVIVLQSARICLHRNLNVRL